MTLLSYDLSNVQVEACGRAIGGTQHDFGTFVPRMQDGIAWLQDQCGHDDGFFLDLPLQSIEKERQLAERIREQFDTLVIIGIGGSSLGTRAIYNALINPYTYTPRNNPQSRQGMRLHFIENVDPVEIADLLQILDLKRTAFNVVTKSGTTIETISGLLIIRDRLIRELGQEGYRQRVVCTTDRGANPLRHLANEEGLQILDIPPAVGGRYSALSSVGTFPLLCAGMDVQALLDGAKQARNNVLNASLENNLAGLFASIQTFFIESGPADVVFMSYVPQLADLGEWFVQLWAESLGKRKPNGDAVGPTPIPAIGARDQHSLLQLMMDGPPIRNVVFLEDTLLPRDLVVPEVPDALKSLEHLGNRPIAETLYAERKGVEAALREAQRPSSAFFIHGIREETIGALMLILEAATAITGMFLGVDPFNQPGVELGKRYAHGILGHPEHTGKLKKLQEDEQRIPIRHMTF